MPQTVGEYPVPGPTVNFGKEMKEYCSPLPLESSAWGTSLFIGSCSSQGWTCVTELNCCRTLLKQECACGGNHSQQEKSCRLKRRLQCQASELYGVPGVVGPWGSCLAGTEQHSELSEDDRKWTRQAKSSRKSFCSFVIAWESTTGSDCTSRRMESSFSSRATILLSNCSLRCWSSNTRSYIMFWVWENNRDESQIRHCGMWWSILGDIRVSAAANFSHSIMIAENFKDLTSPAQQKLNDLSPINVLA